MYPNLFLLFIAMLTHCFAHSRVPVLLIDYQGSYKEKEPSLKPNPFHEISTGYFTDILYDIIEKTDSVVVFAEENLSPEDISSQDDQGSPYINMQRHFTQDKIIFLPAVYKPYRVLTQNLQLSTANFINVTDANIGAAEIFSRKFFYVFFKDPPSLTRIEKIRRHDEIMEQILKNVKINNTQNVVAIYTGIHNPAADIAEELPEIRRQAKTEPSLTVQSKNTMFRFTGLSMKTAMRQSLDYHAPLHAEEFSWGDTLKTRVTSQDFVLEFYFVLGKDTWLLDRVTMLEDGEEVGVTRMDVRVPWKRSFICANPLIIVNNRDGSAIVIPEYQIEPFQPSRPTHEKPRRHVIDDYRIERIAHRNANVSIGGAWILASASPMSVTKYQYVKFSRSPQWTSSILFQVNESPITTSATVKPLAYNEAEPLVPAEDDLSTTPTEESPLLEADEAEQIQKYFSDAVVCCPYFTPGILMGGFVVLISVGILLIGIFVLMNCCNSNDRFDQPQQLCLFDLPAAKSG